MLYTNVFQMTYICSYDISSVKTRIKVAKYLERHALRIQKSVFVVESVGKEHDEIYNFINDSIKEEDSFYLIPVCKQCLSENMHIGHQPFILSERFLIL